MAAGARRVTFATRGIARRRRRRVSGDHVLSKWRALDPGDRGAMANAKTARRRETAFRSRVGNWRRGVSVSATATQGRDVAVGVAKLCTNPSKALTQPERSHFRPRVRAPDDSCPRPKARPLGRLQAGHALLRHAPSRIGRVPRRRHDRRLPQLRHRHLVVLDGHASKNRPLDELRCGRRSPSARRLRRARGGGPTVSARARERAASTQRAKLLAQVVRVPLEGVQSVLDAWW